MTLIGKPFPRERTKFCFVYCGPDRCDCGATDMWVYSGPDLPPPVEVVEKESDPYDHAMDIVRK